MSVFGRNILEASNFATVNGYLCQNKVDIVDATYQHKMNRLLDDIYEYEDQIADDNEAMWSLYESKYGLTYSFLTFGNLKNEIEQQIIDMKELLEGEVEDQVKEMLTMPDFSDISGTIANLSNLVDSDEMEDQIIDAMVRPIVDSVGRLSEFLPDLGLPKIPIVPDLGKIIRTFATIGRLIYNMPEEYTKQASTEFDGQSTEEKTKLLGKLGELAKEIAEMIKTAMSQIPNILICIVFVSILKILDIFKPIIDMFKLDLTMVINILSVAKIAAEAYATGGASLVNRLKKYFLKKINKFMYILQYLYSSCEGNLPVDKLILECQRDILSCTAEISGLNLERDLQMSLYQIEKTKIAEEKISKEFDKLTKQKDKMISLRNGLMSTAGVTESEIVGMQNRLSELEAQMQYLIAAKDVKQSAVDACTAEAKKQFVDNEMLGFNLDSTGEKYLVAIEAQRQLEQDARIQEAQQAIINGVDMGSDLANRFVDRKLNISDKLRSIGNIGFS